MTYTVQSKTGSFQACGNYTYSWDWAKCHKLSEPHAHNVNTQNNSLCRDNIIKFVSFSRAEEDDCDAPQSVVSIPSHPVVLRISSSH